MTSLYVGNLSNNSLFWARKLHFFSVLMFPHRLNSKQEGSHFLLNNFFSLLCFAGVFPSHTHLESPLTHTLTFTSTFVRFSFWQFSRFCVLLTSDFSRCRAIGSKKSLFEYSQLWQYLGIKHLLKIWTKILGQRR